VEPPGRTGPRHRVTRLEPGSERDGVIRATWVQQPFPANLLYRAARAHVAAVGVFLRLEPADPGAAGVAGEAGAAGEAGVAGDAAPHEPATGPTDLTPVT
jgi:hypothetical protein